MNLQNLFLRRFSCNSEIRNSELQNKFKSMKSHYDVCYSKPDYILSVELVGNMIDQLHFGKAAEIDGLTIKHTKYCHPILFVLLTDLLNLMQLYTARAAPALARSVPDRGGAG